jgi:hypothetical protein
MSIPNYLKRCLKLIVSKVCNSRSAQHPELEKELGILADGLVQLKDEQAYMMNREARHRLSKIVFNCH